MNSTSVTVSASGISTNEPIPIGMDRELLIILESPPSGFCLTWWNNGVRISEYWNRFHRNHRCPSAHSFPNTGTQKIRLLQTIPNRKEKVRPDAVISSPPRMTDPANPIVQAPKNMGMSSLLTLSCRNICHVLLLKAKAVPIPEIMNRAASLHWCIQCRTMLVKSTDSAE